MEFLKKYKTIFITFTIIIIGGIIYTVLIGRKGDEGLLLTSDINTALSDVTVSTGENELLSILSNIRLIRLDSSVFSKNSFKSLEDFSQTIVSEPVGRDNPFAPIGFVENILPKPEILE